MYTIKVEPDGALTMVHRDDYVSLAEQGAVSIERASHVEPDREGLWWADLSPVGGPMLGPYKLRSEALQAELAWINVRHLDS